MVEPAFRDLRCAYLRGDPVVVADLPDDVHDVLALSATGKVLPASMGSGAATLDNVPLGTHALQALSSTGDVLAEQFFSVRNHRGEDPIPGFATSFDEASRDDVLRWLRELRCTVVQIYDWMDSYSTPLATSDAYEDPLGRSISRRSLQGLIDGVKESGSVAQAYAPVIAADDELANEHSDWRLYRNDGVPESLGDLLQIMDPGNAEWQSHWIENYGAAIDALGFDGLHLDTYGYPRDARDAAGRGVDLEAGYTSFVSAVRHARPSEVLSFNQVNGVPRNFAAPTSPSFRYVEVWSPNSQWRHLEDLLARSAGGYERHGDTLALYPAVWDASRAAALRTCVLSEAIATVLGASILIWGDRNGVLCHPYYVTHESLDDDERATVLRWHRFALRCRDLFRVANDTSWYELSDENASVQVSWEGKSEPEPAGGSLFTRVIREENLIAVSLLDLTGSGHGDWTLGTEKGRCASADVDVLCSPEKWHAEAAILGRDEGRFAPVAREEVAMREGRGIRVSVPIVDGWSVLRLTPKESL
jgi:dextranase